MPTPSLIRADAGSRGETAVLPAFGIGESMSIRDYVERIILTDPEFVSLRRRCRWQNSVMFGRHFRPANFTSDRVEKFGKAVATLLICEPDRRPDILDHLWRGEPGSSWPLTLRMAQRKNPTDGLVETDVPEQPDPSNVLGLEELKDASLRRDVLVSQMIEAIANGEIRVTGFLAGDVKRQRLEIVPEWWLDPAMVCNWQTEELLPANGAAVGTPYYRGLQIASKSDAAPAIYETGVGGRPSSRHLFMAKMAERAAADPQELESFLVREAAWLNGWLSREHPNAPPATPKTIEEAIRADYRRLKIKPG